MKLNSKMLNSADGPNTMQTILHELQHPIQTREGWPEGANSAMFQLTPKHHRGMSLMNERGPHTEETKHLLDWFRKFGDDPHATYRHTLGEQQAEVTADRFTKNLFGNTKNEVPPYSDYANLGNALDTRKAQDFLTQALRTWSPINEKNFGVPEDVIKGATQMGVHPRELHEALVKHERNLDLDDHELDMIMDFFDLPEHKNSWSIPDELEPPHPSGIHPKHTENIKKMTFGKKSHFDELTDDELDRFFNLGLDEGIEVK